MKDGHTRKLARSEAAQALFLGKHRITLVALDGPTAGNEYELESETVTLGRGPDVTLAFDDDSMSRQHVAFDLLPDGFRLRDLGSTNGTTVNGTAMQSADLKHGDKVGVGEHTFQYIVERRSAIPAYDLPDA